MVFARLNALDGWREYRVCGALPALFLNRWAKTGLPLLGAEALDEFTLLVRVRSRDGARAERLARKCQFTAELTDTGGAPRLAKSAKRRAAAVLGLVLMLAALGWGRFHIWEIEIIGAETLSEARIRSALAECGVDLGCFWPGITADLLRSRLLEELPELRWATVNVYGSRAEVLVRERIPKPEIWNADEPVDIVSEKTGFVTRVLALNGTAQVRPGSAVAPGEILIGGWADSGWSGRRLLHAAGIVEAETWYELSAVTPLTRTEKREAGKAKRRWAIQIGKRRWNLYGARSLGETDCDRSETSWSLASKGLFSLPLTLLRETWQPVETVAVPLDKGEAEKVMEAELHQRLLEAIGDDGEILEEHYSAGEQGGCLNVCLRARCRETLGRETPHREEIATE